MVQPTRLVHITIIIILIFIQEIKCRAVGDDTTSSEATIPTLLESSTTFIDESTAVTESSKTDDPKSWTQFTLKSEEDVTNTTTKPTTDKVPEEPEARSLFTEKTNEEENQPVTDINSTEDAEIPETRDAFNFNSVDTEDDDYEETETPSTTIDPDDPENRGRFVSKTKHIIKNTKKIYKTKHTSKNVAVTGFNGGSVLQGHNVVGSGGLLVNAGNELPQVTNVNQQNALNYGVGVGSGLLTQGNTQILNGGSKIIGSLLPGSHIGGIISSGTAGHAGGFVQTSNNYQPQVVTQEIIPDNKVVMIKTQSPSITHQIVSNPGIEIVQHTLQENPHHFIANTVQSRPLEISDGLMQTGNVLVGNAYQVNPVVGNEQIEIAGISANKQPIIVQGSENHFISQAIPADTSNTLGQVVIGDAYQVHPSVSSGQIAISEFGGGEQSLFAPVVQGSSSHFISHVGQNVIPTDISVGAVQPQGVVIGNTYQLQPQISATEIESSNLEPNIQLIKKTKKNKRCNLAELLANLRNEMAAHAYNQVKPILQPQDMPSLLTNIESQLPSDSKGNNLINNIKSLLLENPQPERISYEGGSVPVISVHNPVVDTYPEEYHSGFIPSPEIIHLQPTHDEVLQDNQNIPVIINHQPELVPINIQEMIQPVPEEPIQVIHVHEQPEIMPLPMEPVNQVQNIPILLKHKPETKEIMVQYEQPEIIHMPQHEEPEIIHIPQYEQPDIIHYDPETMNMPQHEEPKIIHVPQYEQPEIIHVPQYEQPEIIHVPQYEQPEIIHVPQYEQPEIIHVPQYEQPEIMHVPQYEQPEIIHVPQYEQQEMIHVPQYEQPEIIHVPQYEEQERPLIMQKPETVEFYSIPNKQEPTILVPEFPKDHIIELQPTLEQKPMYQEPLIIPQIIETPNQFKIQPNFPNIVQKPIYQSVITPEVTRPPNPFETLVNFPNIFEDKSIMIPEINEKPYQVEIQPTFPEFINEQPVYQIPIKGPNQFDTQPFIPDNTHEFEIQPIYPTIAEVKPYQFDAQPNILESIQPIIPNIVEETPIYHEPIVLPELIPTQNQFEIQPNFPNFVEEQPIYQNPIMPEIIQLPNQFEIQPNFPNIVEEQPIYQNPIMPEIIQLPNQFEIQPNFPNIVEEQPIYQNPIMPEIIQLPNQFEIQPTFPEIIEEKPSFSTPLKISEVMQIPNQIEFQPNFPNIVEERPLYHQLLPQHSMEIIPEIIPNIQNNYGNILPLQTDHPEFVNVIPTIPYETPNVYQATNEIIPEPNIAFESDESYEAPCLELQPEDISNVQDILQLMLGNSVGSKNGRFPKNDINLKYSATELLQQISCPRTKYLLQFPQYTSPVWDYQIPKRTDEFPLLYQLKDFISLLTTQPLNYSTIEILGKLIPFLNNLVWFLSDIIKAQSFKQPGTNFEPWAQLGNLNPGNNLPDPILPLMNLLPGAHVPEENKFNNLIYDLTHTGLKPDTARTTYPNILQMPSTYFPFRWPQESAPDFLGPPSEYVPVQPLDLLQFDEVNKPNIWGLTDTINDQIPFDFSNAPPRLPGWANMWKPLSEPQELWPYLQLDIPYENWAPVKSPSLWSILKGNKPNGFPISNYDFGENLIPDTYPMFDDIEITPVDIMGCSFFNIIKQKYPNINDYQLAHFIITIIKQYLRVFIEGSYVQNTIPELENFGSLNHGIFPKLSHTSNPNFAGTFVNRYLQKIKLQMPLNRKSNVDAWSAQHTYLPEDNEKF